MFRDKVRRERFWLFLGALLIAIFVWQRETVPHGAQERYDTAGMTRLVERTVEVPAYVVDAHVLPKPRPWRPVTAASPAPTPRSEPVHPEPVRVAAIRDDAGDSDDRLVTGSIDALPAVPLARPSALPFADRSVQVASLEPAAPAGARSSVARYYVQLGSYRSIDAATRRYLDLSGKKADLQGDERIFIEEADVGGERFHRVRMGGFASERDARAACARAGIPGSDCAVVAFN